ncbi:DHHC-type zinc finger family protein [Artemisia annua]|uniref:S-acyltransferase n=1 Tax=Artemisia annua TaxID=35608 RepID=A0A2U1Q8W2_ARTAN|nr:DHHC-type zinc finger family protein [Artemisia annua]
MGQRLLFVWIVYLNTDLLKVVLYEEALKKRCDKCSAYKPPRAHHCRICRRCVLKMDHHCTWINNCVGQRNYKAFFLLVFYAAISCLHSMVIIIGCGFQKDWESAGSTRLKTFYITSGVMISLLSLTLGTLLGWHIYLLTHNMTTIEYYEGTRAAWLAQKSGQIYKHAYDVGVYRNLTMILGPSMLRWPLPSAMGHVKDGTSFPTKYRGDVSAMDPRVQLPVCDESSLIAVEPYMILDRKMVKKKNAAMVYALVQLVN